MSEPDATLDAFRESGQDNAALCFLLLQMEEELPSRVALWGAPTLRQARQHLSACAAKPDDVPSRRSRKTCSGLGQPHRTGRPGRPPTSCPKCLDGNWAEIGACEP